MKQSYAFMRGGCIYTAEPIPEHILRDDRRLRGYRYYGYCDGHPCGYFRTKGHFERFVESQPQFTGTIGPHSDDVSTAMAWSQWEGLQILAALCKAK